MEDYGVLGTISDIDLQKLENPPKPSDGLSREIDTIAGGDAYLPAQVPIMSEALSPGISNQPLMDPQRTYLMPGIDRSPVDPMGAYSVFTGGNETVVPLLAVAGVALVGGIYYGLWGAGAGGLLTGGAINLYRSASAVGDDKSRHLMFALIAGGAGGYLGYKGWKAKKGLDK